MAAEVREECHSCDAPLLRCEAHGETYCEERGCEPCEAETIQRLLTEREGSK